MSYSDVHSIVHVHTQGQSPEDSTGTKTDVCACAERTGAAARESLQCKRSDGQVFTLWLSVLCMRKAWLVTAGLLAYVEVTKTEYFFNGSKTYVPAVTPIILTRAAVTAAQSYCFVNVHAL